MGAPHQVEPGYILVLFDGVCNLCSGAVMFIIKRDPVAKFKFASLQSAFGQAQLIRYGLDPNAFHSIIVIENNTVLKKSDAALKIAEQLSSPWRRMAVFRFVPKFLRDLAYDLIAATRYKVFGRKDSCMIPTPELKARFLD